jgi:aspartate/methionine/tyrosine aminotransferase
VSRYKPCSFASGSSSLSSPLGCLHLYHSPHNPLGKCYVSSNPPSSGLDLTCEQSPKAIKALLAFCQKYQVHFISDEIYALSKSETTTPIPAHEFVSVLSIPLDGLIDPHLVHVTYGMSKDFSCNGMRLGVFVTQHNPGAYAAMASLSLFAWPSSPAMELWTRMLDDRTWLDSYLEENSKRLAMYYKRAVQWLERNNIDYVKGGSAYLFSGYFSCYRG